MSNVEKKANISLCPYLLYNDDRNHYFIDDKDVKFYSLDFSSYITCALLRIPI